MNLREIANIGIQAVNPNIEATIYKANGWTLNPDRSRTPAYDPPLTMMVQKQAMSQADLRHIDSMGLQGQFLSIYTNGNWCGLNRKANEGGDIFQIGSDKWRVISIPENWENWTRVIVCL